VTRLITQLFRLLSFLLAAVALPAVAQAQTVNLYCTHPNLALAVVVDVDYASNSVTYRYDMPSATGRRASARVTDTQIQWEQVSEGSGTVYQSLNRITADLNTCDKSGCVLRSCKPAQRQF
jgi:hypothetical protein